MTALSCSIPKSFDHTFITISKVRLILLVLSTARNSISTYDCANNSHLKRLSNFDTFYRAIQTPSSTYVCINHPCIRSLITHFLFRHYHHFYIYRDTSNARRHTLLMINTFDRPSAGCKNPYLLIPHF